MKIVTPVLKEVRVLFEFAQAFQEAWSQAKRRDLRSVDLIGFTTFGPETPLGKPLLLFRAESGSAVFVGPRGAGKYTSVDMD